MKKLILILRTNRGLNPRTTNLAPAFSLASLNEERAGERSLRAHGGIFVSLFALALLTATAAFAQPFSIDWHKVAGGGGTSSGSTHSLSGTIGQQDAGNAIRGSTFSVTGGFWSIIAVVPAPGVPNLIIQSLGPGSVKVSWPNTGSFTLQQNSNLATGTWTTSGYTMTTANGTNSITVTPPMGNVFFRLSNP